MKEIRFNLSRALALLLLAGSLAAFFLPWTRVYGSSFGTELSLKQYLLAAKSGELRPAAGGADPMYAVREMELRAEVTRRMRELVRAEKVEDAKVVQGPWFDAEAAADAFMRFVDGSLTPIRQAAVFQRLSAPADAFDDGAVSGRHDAVGILKLGGLLLYGMAAAMVLSFLVACFCLFTGRRSGVLLYLSVCAMTLAAVAILNALLNDCGISDWLFGEPALGELLHLTAWPVVCVTLAALGLGLALAPALTGGGEIRPAPASRPVYEPAPASRPVYETFTRAAFEPPAAPWPAPDRGGWSCPACGTANAESDGFCPVCGKARPLPVRCAYCGGLIAADTLFCPVCGWRRT